MNWIKLGRNHSMFLFVDITFLFNLRLYKTLDVSLCFSYTWWISFVSVPSHNKMNRKIDGDSCKERPPVSSAQKFFTSRNGAYIFSLQARLLN